MNTNGDKAKDWTALVTGAGRGIGRAVAMDLSRGGIFVYINYLSGRKSAQETLEAVHREKGTARLIQFDQTDPEACKTAVKEIIHERGRIDILVNNAGIREDQVLAMMKEESWQRVIDTNLTGFFHVTKPVIKQMIKHRAGRIVNITSAAGQTGNPGQVNYSASKAGLIGATKALAREVGSRGITVNAVAPGFIQTDMTKGLDTQEIAAAIPAGRLGRPEEVAAVVSFLCRPEAAYVNGQVIGVNGGIL